jgi:hypothetical protein
MDKTSYVASSNKMTFVMPDRRSHEVLACRVDHPKTICEVMDVISGLTPYERRAVIVMATEYEMHNMYPRLSPEFRVADPTRLLKEDEG